MKLQLIYSLNKVLFTASPTNLNEPPNVNELRQILSLFLIRPSAIYYCCFKTLNFSIQTPNNPLPYPVVCIKLTLLEIPPVQTKGNSKTPWKTFHKQIMIRGGQLYFAPGT